MTEMSGKIERIYMSPNEAAERYGLCRSNIYAMLNLPDCPETLLVGRRRLLPIAEFDKYLKETYGGGRK